MDYKRHYERLIERANKRTIEGYAERHHIIPRCMGGDDNPTNITPLTAREHFIAHILLVKMYPKESGLIYAVNMMTKKFTEKRANNRMYGWLKEEYSKVNSANKTGNPDTTL